MVDVVRLRGIAETVRQLPSFYYARPTAAQYFGRVCEGAKFIREAETLGAFQGDSVNGRIGKKLRHPSCHNEHVGPTPAGDMPAWRLPVWYAVVDTLAPELVRKRSRAIVTDANGNRAMLVDTSPEEAEIVARAIEAGADWLEAQIKAEVVPPRGRGKAGPRKEPAAKAFLAYRLHRFSGWKQEDIAGKMGVAQKTISKWTTAVSKWCEAGNPLPDVDAVSRKIQSLDPAVIELGVQIERRTPRQRNKANR
jgi:hypothetical protein